LLRRAPVTWFELADPFKTLDPVAIEFRPGNPVSGFSDHPATGCQRRGDPPARCRQHLTIRRPDLPFFSDWS